MEVLCCTCCGVHIHLVRRPLAHVPRMRSLRIANVNSIRCVHPGPGPTDMSTADLQMVAQKQALLSAMPADDPLVTAAQMQQQAALDKQVRASACPSFLAP